MKTYQALIIASLLHAPPVFAQRLIPFDAFFVSVETNDWMNRSGEGDRLNVSVQVSRGAEKPNGSTSINVDCYEFDAHQRMLPNADLKAFLEAGNAAKDGKDYRMEVMTETFRGEQKSLYEVVLVDGKKMIRMSRGEEKAEFLPSEADNVRHALIQAKSGEAWFKKLLSDDKMPKANQEAKPPQANGYYLSSAIGTISGRGISYEISVTSHSFGTAPEYDIEHKLCLYSADGELNGTLSGEWVAGLLQKISLALESTNAGRAYSFTSGEDEGRKYSVTANLDTKEADLILNPGTFFKDRNAERGHFGASQLVEIRKLIAGCEERTKWFQSNEHLFFAQSAEKAEQVGRGDDDKPSN